MSEAAILELSDLRRTFIQGEAEIEVLRGVSFRIAPGEVIALTGPSGAGKSTLMKILSGVIRPTSGEIVLDGRPVAFHSTTEARDLGISIIHQELSLAPNLSVRDNIFMGREITTATGVDYAEEERQTRALMEELEEDIDPLTPVEDLRLGQQQVVEIARALSVNARILIMDEPTSSLSEAEARTLFSLVRKLKSEGISIVYISHRMAEIFEICDRITVMRDGHDALTRSTGEVTMQQVIEAMLGEGVEASMQYQARSIPASAATVLEVDNLTLEEKVVDASFTIRAGEIVGLAGLTASGRTEIAEAIFGYMANE